MRSLRGRIPVQRVQLIRVRQIDRPEDVGVEDGERGGEDAEAEADCGCDARREEWGASHPATGVADVLKQLLKPERCPHGARVLLHQCDVAKLEHRPTVRLL